MRKYARFQSSAPRCCFRCFPPVAPDLFPSISYSPPQSGALESMLKPASEVPAFSRELNNTTSGPVVTAKSRSTEAELRSASQRPCGRREPSRPRRLAICHAADADDDDCAAATMLTVDGAVVTLTAPADALPADTEVWLRYSGGSESDHLHDQYNSSAIVPSIAGHPFRTPEADTDAAGVADCDRGRRNGDAHVRPRSRCRLGSHGCCVLE